MKIIEILKEIKTIDFISITLMWMSFLIGIKFPDWDFKMRLKHRNILTHSPLILWVLIFFYKTQNLNNNVEIFRFIIMGFSTAIGLHMVYDFFPKSWKRGALIYFPVVKRGLGVRGSKIFIFLTAIYSIFLSIKYSKVIEELLLLFVLCGYVLVKSIKKEEKFFRPISLYFITLLVGSALKYKVIGDFVYNYSHYLFQYLTRYLQMD